MKHLLSLLSVSVALVSCGPEGASPSSSSSENNGGSASKTATHQVCTKNDNSELIANGEINNSEDLLLVESLTLATNDFLDSLADDDFGGGTTGIVMNKPNITYALKSPLTFYACSNEQYELNGCNWNTRHLDPNQYETVTTTITDNAYRMLVEAYSDNETKTLFTIAGTVGDLGNVTYDIYENNVTTATYTLSRTNNGTETVQLVSEDANWTMSENVDCSGSLTLTQTKDGDDFELDTNWTFNGTKTSGQVTFTNKTNNEVYQGTW